MDRVDWSLLAELQTDARLSYNELSRRIHMSSPAVAERVRRLEEQGVITGYHAHLDLNQAGWPVSALVRLSCYGSQCILNDRELAACRNILAIHRVTGSECSVVLVVAESMQEFERIIDRFPATAHPTSMMLLSSPLGWRQVKPPP